MLRIQLVLLALVTIQIAAPQAHAIPLLHVTCEQEDFRPGSLPPTADARAGAVSERPTALLRSAPGRAFVIKQDYTDAGTGIKFGDGKVVVLSCTDGDSDGPVMIFQGADSDVVSDGVVIVKMDLLIDSNTPGSGTVQLQARLNDEDSRAKLVINPANGTLSLSVSQMPHASAASTIAVTPGRPASLEWRFDLNAKTQQLFVDLHDENGAQLGCSVQLEEDTRFSRLTLIPTSAGFRGVIAIDNLQIAPELVARQPTTGRVGAPRPSGRSGPGDAPGQYR